MGEEIEVGGLSVVKIEPGQGGSAGEEETTLMIEESEKQIPLERGQLIGR